MSLVNIADLEKRYRKLSDAERERAEVLIEDAEAYIIAQGADLDAVPIEVLVPIVCAMVRRVIPQEGGGAAIESEQLTAGPFSQTYKFSKPTGDMYMTKAERRMLGITSQRIGVIAPKIGGIQ